MNVRFVKSGDTIYRIENGVYCMVARRGDTSPVATGSTVATEPFSYDSTCGCCWLGIKHSLELHQELVRDFELGE